MKDIREIWVRELSSLKRASLYFGSLIALLIGLRLMTQFVTWVETRVGVPLEDPVMSWVGPIDLTWPVFLVLYSSLIFAIVTSIRNPKNILIGIHAYLIMLVLRATCMYLTPLEPPAGIILLADPLVEAYGTGKPLSRDLFFSGHTATMFVFVFMSKNPWVRAVLLCGALFVGFGVIVQHVHYSIDVIVAIVATYASAGFARFLHQFMAD